MFTFIINIFFILLFHVFSKELSIDTIKISWNDAVDSTDIVMTNSMANNNWFAFGFSNDKSMVNIFIILKSQILSLKFKSYFKREMTTFVFAKLILIIQFHYYIIIITEKVQHYF
jgi:hypothetical protein